MFQTTNQTKNRRCQYSWMKLVGLDWDRLGLILRLQLRTWIGGTPAPLPQETIRVPHVDPISLARKISNRRIKKHISVNKTNMIQFCNSAYVIINKEKERYNKVEKYTHTHTHVYIYICKQRR